MTKDSIDYFELYCNYRDEAFLETLPLPQLEKEVLLNLGVRHAPDNRCFIPDFQLEDVIGESALPYTAWRGMHRLEQDRFIFRADSEQVVRNPESTAAKVDAIHENALAAADKAADKVPHGDIDKYYNPERRAIEKEREARAQQVKEGNLLFRKGRAFTINVEYPVLFFCLEEEAAQAEEWDGGLLDELYKAIAADRLGTALHDMGYVAILEFLNYIQGLFGQSLSRVA